MQVYFIPAEIDLEKIVVKSSSDLTVFRIDDFSKSIPSEVVCPVRKKKG